MPVTDVQDMRVQVLSCAGIETVLYSQGEGPTVLPIHGSGPGVSALGNWESLMNALSPRFHPVAMDLAGIGRSKVSKGRR